ncbi:putative 2-hydroxyacid dehydrogenase protein [Neofusicoccum parvum UCRNP2]|uniref:2-hydroxyacid dehydrogenase n=3 Tax=Neofusicoccum TaxID=407951 RepID=A0ACB5RPF7_9PEZI|nr:putative 2-hydroxyacid dehydrogenase protein [Neofusicoccum parvum UCRNP2]GME22387.1 2-hydroxyacid dehydrogenase [Neofusicoccum parvum]
MTMGGGPELKSLHERILVALPGPKPIALLDRLKNKFPHVEIEFAELDSSHSGDIPKEVFADKTILVTFNGLPKSLDEVPKLKWLHLLSAGSNHIQKHPIYTDSDITITTSSGIHGPQIAEWVLMTTLVRTHFYNSLHDAQKEHKWAKYSSNQTVYDLVGQRLGVLGYGSIGRQVGRVAKAMGMDVIAYTATPKDTPAKRRDHGFIVPGTGDADGSIPSAWYSGLDAGSLHAFLRQDIDILLVSVPLTPETRGFLGAAAFRALADGTGQLRPHRDPAQGGRGPVVVNISRGQIVDQPALVAALEAGVLGGAALDVTDPEPLPEDDPLWSAPNVTITPHISGNGASYTDRSFQILEEDLGRRERGERLLNVVDRERGY